MSNQQLPHPRIARENAELSPVQLAAKASVSFSTVVNCEKSGKYPVNINTRAAYLKALGIKE